METGLEHLCVKTFTWKLLLTMHAFVFLFSHFKRRDHLARHHGGDWTKHKGKNRFLFLWSPLWPPLRTNYLQTSKPQPQYSMFLNIYIYIYICVCVCVFVFFFFCGECVFIFDPLKEKIIMLGYHTFLYTTK
jgi:hypothetical protein